MEKDKISIKIIVAAGLTLSAILILYNLFSSPKYNITHTALNAASETYSYTASVTSSVSSSGISSVSSSAVSETVSFAAPESAVSAEEVSSEADASAGSSESSGLININTADADELQKIKHIGPVLAGRIIEYRELNGPFDSLDELVEVRGIGEKTLAVIKEYACV